MDQMDEELMSTNIGQSFNVAVSLFFLLCDCNRLTSSLFWFLKPPRPLPSGLISLPV